MIIKYVIAIIQILIVLAITNAVINQLEQIQQEQATTTAQQNINNSETHYQITEPKQCADNPCLDGCDANKCEAYRTK